MKTQHKKKLISKVMRLWISMPLSPKKLNNAPCLRLSALCSLLYPTSVNVLTNNYGKLSRDLHTKTFNTLSVFRTNKNSCSCLTMSLTFCAISDKTSTAPASELLNLLTFTTKMTVSMPRLKKNSRKEDRALTLKLIWSATLKKQ